jgi:hypothetical protein
MAEGYPGMQVFVLATVFLVTYFASIAVALSWLG